MTQWQMQYRCAFSTNIYSNNADRFVVPPMTSRTHATPAESISDQPPQPLAVIILAAGHGTRMNSSLPKVLHEIAGLPMLGHVIGLAEALSPERIAVVIGSQAPQVGDVAQRLHPDIDVFVQDPPQGTGDAVKQALPTLDGFEGTILVLYADTPLTRPETLKILAEKITGTTSVAVLGFHPTVDHSYGRLVMDGPDTLSAIVEAKDASPEELTITFCNSGVMAIASQFLLSALPNLTNDNAKSEYYLTDLVKMAGDAGLTATAVKADEWEVMGVDARTDLALAEAIYQKGRRKQAMENGVTLTDPETVYFSVDTTLGKDVTIGPNVVFGPGVHLADHVEVKAFCHIEGATLASGVSVGPYARLRPGADLGEDVKVGNFVEIKKSTLAKGAKVSHLSYIGDASLGEAVNIGAGTITCNYDGFNKFKTIIGDGAFIGSNSSLVAPVEIKAGAYVGSGSVITKTVGADALAVARGRQVEIANWAAKFRTKNK